MGAWLCIMHQGTSEGQGDRAMELWSSQKLYFSWVMLLFTLLFPLQRRKRTGCMLVHPICLHIQACNFLHKMYEVVHLFSKLPNITDTSHQRKEEWGPGAGRLLRDRVCRGWSNCCRWCIPHPVELGPGHGHAVVVLEVAAAAVEQLLRQEHQVLLGQAPVALHLGLEFHVERLAQLGPQDFVGHRKRNPALSGERSQKP